MEVSFIELPKFIPYLDSLDIMRDSLEQVSLAPDRAFILFAEYHDTYTAGSSTAQADLNLLGEGLEVIKADRGGRLTYHGPGQSVIYPVIHLMHFNYDIKRYISFLARVLIDVLSGLGLQTVYKHDPAGIWTSAGEKKIASIGIRVKKWIAHHGIAVNISTRLAAMQKISPCGLKASSYTSLKDLGAKIELSDFNKLFAAKFVELFGVI